MKNLVKSNMIPSFVVQQVIQWHNNYIKRNNLRQSKNDLFDNPQLRYMCDNFSGTIGVVDYFNKTYIYINKRCEEMFGYSQDDFKMRGLELVLQLLKKEHVDVFNKIYVAVFDLFQQYAEADETKKLKITFTNQIKTKDGTYKWMLHEMAVLETDDKGMPILVIKMITDIDEIKKDKGLDFIVTKKDEDGIYKTILKKSFLLVEEDSLAITEREREVLQLVSQGLSAKQIANYLFISEHTVYTHKKNMLKKFQLSSSNELVMYASSQGLIY